MPGPSKVPASGRPSPATTAMATQCRGCLVRVTQRLDPSRREALQIAAERFEQRFHFLRELAPGGCQVHAPAGAEEERHPERAFELRDLAAEGRLGDSEGLRGLAKVQVQGYFPEVDQVAEFEWELIRSGHQ